MTYNDHSCTLSNAPRQDKEDSMNTVIAYDQLSKHHRLRLARQCRFKTAKAFAESLGIFPANYSRQEKGNRVVADKSMRKYAEVLGANFNWLKSGEGLCYKDPELNNLIDNYITQERVVIPATSKVNPEVLSALLAKMLSHKKEYNSKQQALIIANAYTEVMTLSDDPAEQLKMSDNIIETILKFSDQFDAAKNPS